MKIALGVSLTLSMLTGQGVAQQPVADSGPTLAVTMQFLSDKLKEFGTHAYTQGDEHGVMTVTRVIADPTTCTVRYEYEDDAVGGSPLYEKATVTRIVPLRLVESVSVLTSPITFNEDTHQLIPEETKPGTYYVLVIAARRSLSYWDSSQVSNDGRKYKKGETHSFTMSATGFRMTDAQAADRVSKALQHAVSLCAPKAPAAPPPPDTSKQATDPF